MLASDELPPVPAPAILTGYFKMTPAGPEYTALCGPVTRWAGRLVKAGLFADALTCAGMAEAEGVTFPGEKTNPDERIDHILVSPDLAARIQAAGIDAGADHSLIWAVFNLTGT